MARAEADIVASLASDGYITTRRAAGLYGNTWMVTIEGLKFLAMVTAVVEDEDA